MTKFLVMSKEDFFVALNTLIVCYEENKFFIKKYYLGVIDDLPSKSREKTLISYNDFYEKLQEKQEGEE